MPSKTGDVPETIKVVGNVMIATFPEARGVAVVKETVIALLGAVGTLSASAMKKLTPETRPPRGPEGNVPIWSFDVKTPRRVPSGMASPIVTPVSDTVNVVEAEKEALVSIERTKLLELTAIEEKDPWLGGLVPWVPKVAAEKNPL